MADETNGWLGREIAKIFVFNGLWLKNKSETAVTGFSGGL